MCFENQFLENFSLLLQTVDVCCLWRENWEILWKTALERKSILKTTSHHVYSWNVVSFQISDFLIVNMSSRLDTTKVENLKNFHSEHIKWHSIKDGHIFYSPRSILIEFFHRNRVKFHAPLCPANF